MKCGPVRRTRLTFCIVTLESFCGEQFRYSNAGLCRTCMRQSAELSEDKTRMVTLGMSCREQPIQWCMLCRTCTRQRLSGARWCRRCWSGTAPCRRRWSAACCWRPTAATWPVAARTPWRSWCSWRSAPCSSGRRALTGARLCSSSRVRAHSRLAHSRLLHRDTLSRALMYLTHVSLPLL